MSVSSTGETTKKPKKAPRKPPQAIPPDGKASCGKTPWDRSLHSFRARGMLTRENVWDCVVNKRMSLTRTAETLDLSHERVRQLWIEAQQELIDRAPKSPEDFVFRRQQVADMLMDVHNDANHPELKSSPQSQAVRLKALSQYVELFGLSLAKNPEIAESATAEEVPQGIAELVQQRGYSIHGRQNDIQEAIEAQQMRDVTPVVE